MVAGGLGGVFMSAYVDWYVPFISNEILNAVIIPFVAVPKMRSIYPMKHTSKPCETRFNKLI
jgi:hypothetical protein